MHLGIPRRCRRSILAKSAVCLALSFAAVARAAELASYMPGDVGICVQGVELPGRFRAMLSGTLGQRILAHHAVRQWHSERDGDLKQLKRDLETHFELPFADFCDGVAGKELLLGVWPDEAPGHGDGPALLLAHARNPDILRRAVEALCAEHQKSDKLLSPEHVAVNGQTFELQVLAPEGDDKRLYLIAVGDLGILSNSKPLAVGVLERRTASNPATNVDSLSTLPAYIAAAARLPKQRTFTLFVNPRSWDKLLDHSVKENADNDEFSAAARDNLLAAWRSTEYLAAAVALADEVRCEMVWHARADDLPQEARELAAAVSGRAGFLEFVPQHALVALAGRAQWGRLARLVWGELSVGAARSDNSPNAAAAADVLMQLLERLGPDCGAFVTAAPDKLPDKLPIELAFGLETRTRLPRELASTATDTVDQSLRSALAMVTVLYNIEHPEAKAGLRTERVDGVPITTLLGVSELGDVQPTYTMTANGVLVGTSPQAVAQAATVSAEDSLANSPRVKRVLSGDWTDPSQVLYVDLRGLRVLLAGHEGFAQHVVRHDGVPIEEARRGLKELQELLGLADTVVGACHVAPGDFSAVLHVSAE